MAFIRAFYQYVCKRTSTFTLGIVASAFFFERGYDHVCEYIFERYNEGRLWMHIKDKYEALESSPGSSQGNKKHGGHESVIDSADDRKSG